jgi:hypothetical protein
MSFGRIGFVPPTLKHRNSPHAKRLMKQSLLPIGPVSTRLLARRAATVAALIITQALTVGSAIAACWDTTHGDSRYSVNSNGTVIDTATGLSGNSTLMWKQCHQGLSGSTCATGTASTHTFDQAGLLTSTQGGYNDWRMPSISELQTLVPAACQGAVNAPTINRTAFPGTPIWLVWSGSPNAGDSSSAWYVNFGFGDASVGLRAFPNQVRLVRGGQSFDLLAPTPQTLAFTTPLPSLTLGSSPTVSATSNSGSANSGNPIRYSTTTPTVCSVNASTGQITLTSSAAAGNTCTIAADQYGRINSGVNYAPPRNSHKVSASSSAPKTSPSPAPPPAAQRSTAQPTASRPPPPPRSASPSASMADQVACAASAAAAR